MKEDFKCNVCHEGIYLPTGSLVTGKERHTHQCNVCEAEKAFATLNESKVGLKKKK